MPAKSVPRTVRNPSAKLTGDVLGVRLYRVKKKQHRIFHVRVKTVSGDVYFDWFEKDCEVVESAS